MHRLVKVKVSPPLTAWSHRDKCSHHCHSLLVRAFLLEYCILKPNRERPLNPWNEYVCMHLQLLSINKTGFTYGLKLCILQSAASINTQGDKHLPGDETIASPKCPARHNYNKTSNKHGLQLLQLCRTQGLYIINGRSRGDPYGRYTYSSHLSSSRPTVDYFITDLAFSRKPKKQEHSIMFQCIFRHKYFSLIGL